MLRIISYSINPEMEFYVLNSLYVGNIFLYSSLWPIHGEQIVIPCNTSDNVLYFCVVRRP
jgi:hypothetical protein